MLHAESQLGGVDGGGVVAHQIEGPKVKALLFPGEIVEVPLLVGTEERVAGVEEEGARIGAADPLQLGGPTGHAPRLVDLAPAVLEIPAGLPRIDQSQLANDLPGGRLGLRPRGGQSVERLRREWLGPPDEAGAEVV